MKQNCGSRFIIVLLLLCGNVQFGASFLVHHNHRGGCCHRLYETGLYYKSDHEEPLLTKSSFPHPLSDVTNEAAAASSSSTNTATTTTTTKRRRSFLHQLDRFLTLLQDTSSHLKRHTFLSGNFAPVSEEHIQVPVQIVEGSIPAGFGDGCFCRNGPNPILEMQRKRYHWVSENSIHYIVLDLLHLPYLSHSSLPFYINIVRRSCHATYSNDTKRYGNVHQSIHPMSTIYY